MSVHDIVTAQIRASAEATEETVDIDSLRERVMGRVELLQLLLEVFDSQYPAQIGEIREAVRARNLDDLRRAAHRLVGTLGCFSATRATTAARAVELAAARGDINAALSAFEDLERAMRELAPTLSLLAARGLDAELPQ